MGEIEILKDALTSLKTKQVEIEQQMALPDSSTGGGTCGRTNTDEETAAILRRGDQPLINWLRNQHLDNVTILKVPKFYRFISSDNFFFTLQIIYSRFKLIIILIVCERRCGVYRFGFDVA